MNPALPRQPRLHGAINRSVFLPYNIVEYPFADVVAREVFDTDNLTHLHEVEARRQGRLPTYQDNLQLRAILADKAAKTSLLGLYHQFVEQVVAPVFGGRISYTSKPTFRVHMPGTPSVSDWHTDASVTARLDQIGAWLPFVDAFDSATLWTESDYGAGDFAPIAVAYGETLLFDSGLLRHGSVANTTTITRVSMDFRFAPLTHAAKWHDLGILCGRNDRRARQRSR